MIRRSTLRWLRGLFLWGICAGVLAASAEAKILTIFSDTGISGTDIYNWPNPPAGSVFQSSVAVPSVAVGVPEGQYSMLTQPVSGGYDGWGVIYNPSGVDLSGSFQSGELRFWLYSPTDNLMFSLEHTHPGLDCQGLSQAHAKDCWNFQGSGLANYLNQWVLVTIPMTNPTTHVPVTINDLYSPFEITANSGATFYIDDVRYVDSVGAPVFNVSVNNISDQASVSAITWNTSLPAGWTRANQYINLEMDPYNQQVWGVQIYTNNTDTTASPRFISPTPPGQPGSNPAGLVNFSNVSARVPMAWSINAGTQTAVAAATPAADPNNAADPHSFLWFFMQDQQTPTIPQENTVAFSNGGFNIVKNNQGIQYAQSASGIFGAANPPNYIYLEANFANATSGTYQTDRLTVEFYTP